MLLPLQLLMLQQQQLNEHIVHHSNDDAARNLNAKQNPHLSLSLSLSLPPFHSLLLSHLSLEATAFVVIVGT